MLQFMFTINTFFLVRASNILRLFFSTLFCVLLFGGCQKSTPDEPHENIQSPWIDCYYRLDFSVEAESNTKLRQISLHLSDNYWQYGRLSSPPLRFDQAFFISHDCNLNLSHLVLEREMRDFILNNSILNKITEEEYNQMNLKARRGVITFEK